MNTVQPSHTQTLKEISDEHDLNVSQQGRSLTVSTQSYTIPGISHSTQAATHTTMQQSTNKVIEYHIIILILILLLIQEE